MQEGQGGFVFQQHPYVAEKQASGVHISSRQITAWYFWKFLVLLFVSTILLRFRFGKGEA